MAAADAKPISPILCASLVVLERGALLFAAIGVTRGDARVALFITVFVGLAFVARSAAFSSRVRALEVVTYDALLQSAHRARDPRLTAEALRAALVRGVDATATIRGRIVPALAGEAFAAALLFPYLAWTVPLRALAALAVGALAAAAVTLALRRVAQNLARGAHDLYAAAFRAVMEGLIGREDIVAAGSGAFYRSRVRERTAAWGRSQLRASAGNALLGRAPAFIALAVGAAVYLVIRNGDTLTEMAVPGAMLPPLGGILLGVAEWIQLAPRTRELQHVLDARQEPSGLPAAQSVLPLVVEGLTVRFGDIVALAEVSFTIDRPSLVVFAGPNGSGKSTVLRALLGIVESSGGTIAFGGTPVTKLDLVSLRRRTSYLSQKPHLPTMAPVLEAMTFLDDAPSDRVYAELERIRVLEALRTHSPTEPLGVSVDSLSGGERQRVALARSLLRDVELYLFDEADANLDRRGIDMVVSILKELSKRSVVVVAAHTEEVIAAADVVVHLERGRIVTPP